MTVHTIENTQSLVLELGDATAFLDRRRRECVDCDTRGEIRFEILSARDISMPTGWVLRPLEVGDQDHVVFGLRVDGGRQVLPTAYAWGQISRAMGLGMDDLWKIRAQDGYGGLMSHLNDRVRRKIRAGRFLRMLKVSGSLSVLRAFLPMSFSTGMDNLHLCRALEELDGVRVRRCCLNANDTMRVDGDFKHRSDGSQAFTFSLYASEVGHHNDIVIDVLAPWGESRTPWRKHQTRISYKAKAMHRLSDLVGDATIGGMHNILHVTRGLRGDERVNITIKRSGVSGR